MLQHIENPMQNLLDLQSKAGNLEAQNNLFSLVKLCHNDYTAQYENKSALAYG